MDKKELIKAIETAAAKRATAFNTMLEQMSDASIEAYEAALKVENVLRTQLAAIEAKENGVPANLSEDKPAELSEAQKFIKGLREALAVGDTYTALVPAEIAKQIQAKRDELNEQWNGKRDELYDEKLKEIEDAHNKWLAEKNERDKKREEQEAARGEKVTRSMRMGHHDEEAN